MAFKPLSFSEGFFRDEPPLSYRRRRGATGQSDFFVRLLFEIQYLCYNFPSRRIEAAPRAAADEEKEGMSAGDGSRTT